MRVTRSLQLMWAKQRLRPPGIRILSAPAPYSLCASIEVQQGRAGFRAGEIRGVADGSGSCDFRNVDF